eukprot:1553412-Prymnesium_polylepis.1
MRSARRARPRALRKCSTTVGGRHDKGREAHSLLMPCSPANEHGCDDLRWRRAVCAGHHDDFRDAAAGGTKSRDAKCPKRAA